MLPSFRFALGAIFASTIMIVAAIGFVETIRIAHYAKIMPLEPMRPLAYAEPADRAQFRGDILRRPDGDPRQIEDAFEALLQRVARTAPPAVAQAETPAPEAAPTDVLPAIAGIPPQETVAQTVPVTETAPDEAAPYEAPSSVADTPQPPPALADASPVIPTAPSLPELGELQAAPDEDLSIARAAALEEPSDTGPSAEAAAAPKAAEPSAPATDPHQVASLAFADERMEAAVTSPESALAFVPMPAPRPKELIEATGKKVVKRRIRYYTRPIARTGYAVSPTVPPNWPFN